MKIRRVPDGWNKNPGDNFDIDRSYRIVEFGGGGHGYRRYNQARRAIEQGIKYLRREGNVEEAAALAQWVRGSGGFTRPHTPYYIHVDGNVERIFTAALRAVDLTAYQMCRERGSQWHVAEREAIHVCPHGYIRGERCRHGCGTNR